MNSRRFNITEVVGGEVASAVLKIIVYPVHQIIPSSARNHGRVGPHDDGVDVAVPDLQVHGEV